MLARRLETDVLYLMVYHSDIFFYSFFRNGELLNEYSSDPDYFEEASPAERERLKASPELFRELAGSPEGLMEITRLLNRGIGAIEFDFEENRLEIFAALLGIRNALTSYDYLTRGEHDGIERWKEFVHIPDQSAEKAARKAAAAALRAAKRRLKKAGLLCAECLPPGKKRQRTDARGEFCFDPVSGGLLILWQAFPAPPQLIRLQSPWTRGPQPIEIQFASSRPGGLAMSSRGKWLAVFDQSLKLWDWQRLALINDFSHGGAPLEFSRDETLMVCTGNRGFDIISLETRRLVQSIRYQGSTGLQALHPSGKFLVCRPRQDQLGICNIGSGNLEKVLIFGTKMDWFHLGHTIEDQLSEAGVDSQEFADWTTSLVRGSGHILNLRFSPDGHLLFCSTTTGLRVLAWDELMVATETTPRPLFAVTPTSTKDPAVPDHSGSSDYIYDVSLDGPQNRLLFCGIEGRIRFLDLNDGQTGILIDPPDKWPVCRLQLSPDRKFIACLLCPPFGEGHRASWRLQVWDYAALCQSRGLDR
jgi:hypothetical protein